MTWTDEYEVRHAANAGRGWVVWLVSRSGTLSISNRVRWHETRGAAEVHVRNLKKGKGRPQWMSSEMQS